MDKPIWYGLIARWDDDKGFGFISPRCGGKEVFVHIKAFPNGHRRPAVGDSVSYVPSKDEKGRPRAVEVRFVGQVPGDRVPLGRAGAKALSFAIAFIAAVGVSAYLGKVPWFVPVAYVVASLLAFMYYSIDKSAAQANEWRVPEQTLHVLSLVGGWPGALVGQSVHRHKTKKTPFRIVFWLTVGANCCVLLLVGYAFGST